MPDPKKPVRLQDLDIFDLLRLGHLSEQDKLKKMVQIQQIVFTNFINVDLPAHLTDEHITELEKLSKKKGITPQEVEDFLRSKIKDYDINSVEVISINGFDVQEAEIDCDIFVSIFNDLLHEAVVNELSYAYLED